MDKYYGNVCELDIIFNFQKAYFILDELLLAGEMQESSKKNVLRCISQQDSLEDMEVSSISASGMGRGAWNGRWDVLQQTPQPFLGPYRSPSIPTMLLLVLCLFAPPTSLYSGSILGPSLGISQSALDEVPTCANVLYP